SPPPGGEAPRGVSPRAKRWSRSVPSRSRSRTRPSTTTATVPDRTASAPVSSPKYAHSPGPCATSTAPGSHSASARSTAETEPSSQRAVTARPANVPLPTSRWMPVSRIRRLPEASPTPELESRSSRARSAASARFSEADIGRVYEGPSAAERPLELERAVDLDPEAGAVERRGAQASPLGNGLVDEERAEHRRHAIGLRRHHQELGERASRARDDEVRAVHAGAVRDDEHVMGIGVGGDLQQLGESAAPAHVGLDDVAAAHVDQHPEAEPARLVLARRYEEPGRHPAPELRVAPVVVGRQALLDPPETVRPQPLRE